MTFEQAIKTLVGRNRDLVNKSGKKTEYTRETDEIIEALLQQRSDYMELKQSWSKAQSFINWIAGDFVTHDVDSLDYKTLQLAERNKWKVYRPGLYDEIENFDFSDIKYLISQFKEASEFYKIRFEQTWDSIRSINLDIEEWKENEEIKRTLEDERERLMAELNYCI